MSEEEVKAVKAAIDLLKEKGKPAWLSPKIQGSALDAARFLILKIRQQARERRERGEGLPQWLFDRERELEYNLRTLRESLGSQGKGRDPAAAARALNALIRSGLDEREVHETRAPGRGAGEKRADRERIDVQRRFFEAKLNDLERKLLEGKKPRAWGTLEQDSRKQPPRQRTRTIPRGKKRH
ncbi:MAG TPA: hypothetical protein VJA40_00560 [archaeon]|nr:hypothetical protein [archaeon]